MIRRILTAARTVLGLGLLVYIISRPGVRSALASLFDDPWVLVVLVAVGAAGTVIEAERLRLIFNAARLPLARRIAYRLVPVSTFFNFCIPGGTGGDVVKLYYLASTNRGRGLESATAMIVDRVIGLLALLLLVGGLLVVNHQLVIEHAVLRAMALLVLGGVGGIIVLAGLAWSDRLRASRSYAALMKRVPRRDYIERVLDTAHGFGGARRAILGATLLSLTGNGLVALAFAVLATVVLPTAPWSAVALLSMCGMLANAIPLTPGGIGVGEAAFTHLFGMIGVSGGAALIVLWRIGMLTVAAVGAFIYITGVTGRRGTEIAAQGEVAERREDRERQRAEFSPSGTRTR